MKVLHLNPPNPTTTNVLRDAVYGCWCKGKRIGGAKTPPQPLLSVATTLKEAGHQVEVMDAVNQGISIYALKKRIHEFDAVVVLTSVMTFGEDAQVLGELKEAHPGLLTVIAGAHATFMPEMCLQHEAVDVIVRNEEELVIRDLLVSYERGGEEWKATLGIGLGKNGSTTLNEEYPGPKVLDDIPITDWSLLPKGVYYFYPLVKRYPFVTDLTTRGCPKKCAFCMAPGFYGNKVRGRSAEHIIKGFEHYRSQGYKEIYIKDEMFTSLKKRNDEVFDWMINKEVDLTWFCSAAVGWIDKPMMEKMRRAGCHTIKVGVESGVQDILDRIQKGITLDQIKETFRWAEEVGINTHAHMMIGHPGETEQTIEQTIEFIKKLNPTTVTFGILTPFPGTPIFEELAQEMPEIRTNFNLQLATLHDKSNYTHLICDVKPERLAYFQKKAHRDFYWRPSYMWGWVKRMRDLETAKTVFKAGYKIIDYSIRGD